MRFMQLRCDIRSRLTIAKIRKHDESGLGEFFCQTLDDRREISTSSDRNDSDVERSIDRHGCGNALS
ncbi:MAG: hypothetical protein DDT34_02424 [Firmicutes bacterium]|nr:hypothetical protein [Bacillota bacterium]